MDKYCQIPKSAVSRFQEAVSDVGGNVARSKPDGFNPGVIVFEVVGAPSPQLKETIRQFTPARG